jgi:hypothetical protein
MKASGWLGNVLAVVTVVGMGALGLGCAKTGSVQERAPLTQDIATYRSAAVEVDIPTSVKNAETQKTAFATMIGDKLREKKIFAEIVPTSGELTLRVKVTAVEQGNKMAQAMGPGAGGDSEVAATIDLFDAKQNKSVGAFDVTGNSKKNTQTSVGGVNTAAMEDTTGRALGAAADEIVAYLEKHRGAAK